METPCFACGGKGLVDGLEEDRYGDTFTIKTDCEKCGRVGMIPTPAGRLLLEFVARHVAPNKYWPGYLHIRSKTEDQQVEISDADVSAEASEQGG